MPSKTCGECQKRTTISQRNWKYLDKTGEFICSRECLLRWLDRIEVLPRTPPWLWEVTVNGFGDTRQGFRSDYERYFASWLTGNEIDWQYERYQFPVGEKKRYTPDFYLPMFQVFLETKGQWGLGQHKKIAEFREQYPLATLLVVPWLMHGDFYKEERLELR